MLDGNDRELVKKINYITRQSPFFKKFNQLKYKSPKGYGEYEAATFQLARLFTSYQFFEPSSFEQDFSHKVSLVILNQAYQQGFGSYWLDLNLFKAFNKTHLPPNLLEFKRVIPAGLLFLPPKLRNPDGQVLKWIFFYHQLGGEEIPPITLLKSQVSILPPPSTHLAWLTVLDDSTQYAVSKPIQIAEGQLTYDTDDLYINEILQDEGKNIDTQTEKEFSDQVTELLIQTLLYLQLKPLDLNPVDSPQVHHRSKVAGKKQKLAPIIIGKNYQVKTERSSSRTTGQMGRKSPITHWRRGFYRWQPHGSRKETKYKIVWIEPILVNG